MGLSGKNIQAALFSDNNPYKSRFGIREKNWRSIRSPVFFRLWAMLTNPHSVFTFSRPRKWNRRKPMLCLTCPKTVSTSVDRAARKRCPSGLVRLSRACRRYSSKRKLMRICAVAFGPGTLAFERAVGAGETFIMPPVGQIAIVGGVAGGVLEVQALVGRADERCRWSGSYSKFSARNWCARITPGSR